MGGSSSKKEVRSSRGSKEHSGVRDPYATPALPPPTARPYRCATLSLRSGDTGAAGRREGGARPVVQEDGHRWGVRRLFQRRASAPRTPRPKRPTRVLPRARARQDKTITKEEARKHFKSFAKLNADAMFNEVDDDKNSVLTEEEFMAFWANVLSSGYEPAEVIEEVDNLMKGEAWRDWDDGRTT